MNAAPQRMDARGAIPTEGLIVDKPVARDPAHYVDLAVRIGTDPSYRDALRQRILATCDTLYSDPAAVTEFAAFLRRVALTAQTGATGGR